MQKETERNAPGLMLVKPRKSKYNKTDYSVQKAYAGNGENKWQRKRLEEMDIQPGPVRRLRRRRRPLFVMWKSGFGLFRNLPLPGGTVCRIPVTRYEPEQETESPAFCYFVQKDSGMIRM